MSEPKITVITPTYRRVPDELVAAMAAQTFMEYEWLIVDDSALERTEHEDGRVVVMPPMRWSPYRSLATALNTALVHARGELVVWMTDYQVPRPGVLARHWDLYERYGPNVMIAGLLNPDTRFPWGEEVEPAVVWDATSREGVTNWCWCGRNDSAPLADLIRVNGADMSLDGGYGYIDCEMGARLVQVGCRFLMDRGPADSVCDERHHDRTKASDPVRAETHNERAQGLIASAWEEGRYWAQNDDWSLREERSRLGLWNPGQFTGLPRALRELAERPAVSVAVVAVLTELSRRYPNVDFRAEAAISVGDRCEINTGVIVDANGPVGTDTSITIGDDVIIGPYTVIRSADHRFDDLTRPIREQGHIGAPIVIEDDVWLGARVTVLKGVRIGRGAVVGAGSVVTRDIPPMAVAMGAPARVRRYRDGREKNDPTWRAVPL